MNKKTFLLLSIFFIFNLLYSQINLPIQIHFRDEINKSAAMNLITGPWDKSLRCDALDTMRILPSCCNSTQIIPFLGILPYRFYCEHRATSKGGNYLALLKNYTWGGIKTPVCDSLIIIGPKLKFNKDSVPVLSILASKNNIKMKYQTWPQGPLVTMPAVSNYTAMEVSIVDSTDQLLNYFDTLVIEDGFTWKFSDPARVNNLNYQGIVRFKMRFLGDGDLGIDEVKIYNSPKVFTTQIESCNGRDGKIQIDSVEGFTSPFYYLWSTGSNQTFIDSLEPGRYSVIIEDSKGKLAKREWLIKSKLQLSIDSIKAIDTSGIAGSVFINYGGAKPVNWLWTSPLGFESSIENPNFSKPANYRLIVKDSVGCIADINVAIGIRCDQILTPLELKDTLCFGVLPLKMGSPFPSLVARYWLTQDEILLSNAKESHTAWQELKDGWNTRYVRWIDTINGCIGKSSRLSIFFRPNPNAPKSLNWIECPNSSGFCHAWADTQSKNRLYWRRLNQKNWVNYGSPILNAFETSDLKGNFKWVGKYKDTVSGCFSDTAISTYQVSKIYKTVLQGTKVYSYGTITKLQVQGIPSEVIKNYSISYGGRFEMVGPNGLIHPCNGKTQCITNDSELLVRHTVIPCWTPPRVVSSVKILDSIGVCVSQSELNAENTGSYNCFGTELLDGDTMVTAFVGKSLKLHVPTTSGYHQVDNPLHMIYANCDYFLPFQWQIQYKDSEQWLPLIDVLDSSFSTKTDTNSIYLVITKVHYNLDQCKIRLQIERCKGLWSISSPQTIRFQKDTSYFNLCPNPTMDEFIIQPLNNGDVSIYNIFGHLQFKGNANEKISTKEWNNGIYIVQLERDNADRKTFKLIVAH